MADGRKSLKKNPGSLIKYTELKKSVSHKLSLEKYLEETSTWTWTVFASLILFSFLSAADQCQRQRNDKSEACPNSGRQVLHCDEVHGPAVLVLHAMSNQCCLSEGCPRGTVCSATQPHEIHKNNAEQVLTLCVAVLWNTLILSQSMLIIWKKTCSLFTLAEGNTHQREILYLCKSPACAWVLSGSENVISKRKRESYILGIGSPA